MLVVYAPVIKQAVYIISESQRADGQAILNGELLKSNAVETWMGFISDDGKDASDSVYTGTLVI